MVMQHGRAAPTLGICLIVLSVEMGCGSDSAFRLPDPAVRYVAFGDSSTKGPSERDYVTYLPGLLAASENAFANEGNGGETTGEGLKRLGSLISRKLFPNAKALLYWEGGNDLIDMMKQLDPLLLTSPNSPDYPFAAPLDQMLDTIQGNIETAIGLGKKAGWQVFVATYFFLPAGSLNCEGSLLGILLPGQAANANVYVTKLNERIKLAAANQGAVVVDIAALDATLRGNPLNYENCNHLSAAGNQIAAQVFAQAIQAVQGG